PKMLKNATARNDQAADDLRRSMIRTRTSILGAVCRLGIPRGWTRGWVTTRVFLVVVVGFSSGATLISISLGTGSVIPDLRCFHANRSYMFGLRMARSLALRLRGLRAISSAPGCT